MLKGDKKSRRVTRGRKKDKRIGKETCKLSKAESRHEKQKGDKRSICC